MPFIRILLTERIVLEDHLLVELDEFLQLTDLAYHLEL